MSLIEKIKAESLRLRKERSPIAPSISFAVSEIEKVGKNNGNRTTTDDEAIKTIQKIIGNIESSMTVMKDDYLIKKSLAEVSVLTSFLPTMVSDEEVRTEIVTCIAFGQNKGAIMKHLRSKFGALVDMKLAITMLDAELER